MADIVDTKTRSRMMSRIRGKDTKIEILVRKGIFAKGFRYRLNDGKLPGKPDIVLKKYNAVIFVHGCFWHGHDCHLFKLPSTRSDWWQNKIENNRKRDRQQQEIIGDLGWRQCRIWECAIRGKKRIEFSEIIHEIATWITSNNQSLEIKGKQT